MNVSLNNNVITEPYEHKGKVESHVQSGFSTIKQKDSLVGLKALATTFVSIGGSAAPEPIMEGDTVYFKEEDLHTQKWSQKKYHSPNLEGHFIIAPSSYVIMVDKQ